MSLNNMNHEQVQETEEDRQIAAANPQLFSSVPSNRRVTVEENGTAHPNLGETSVLDDLATVPNGASTMAESQASLTQSVLEQLKLNNVVEAKRPELKIYGRDTFIAFRSNYLDYEKKQGCKSVAELLGKDAYNMYCLVLPCQDLRKEYPYSRNADLLSRMDTHHGLDTTADLQFLLSKQKMQKDKATPADVEHYMGTWTTAFADHKTIQAADANSNQVVKALLKGLHPEVLRNAVKLRDPQKFVIAITVLHEALQTYRQHLQYLADQKILDARKANKPQKPKHDSQSSADRGPRTANAAASTAAPSKASKPTAAASASGPACANCLMMGVSCTDHAVADCPNTCMACFKANTASKHQRRHCKQCPPAKVANSAAASSTSANDTGDDDDSVSTNDMLIDSGANGTYVNNPDYINDLTYSVDRMRTIKVANGSSVPIHGQGLLVDIPCEFVPAFDNSLIGVSNICSIGNICLFDSNKMLAIKTDSPVITQQYNQLIATAATNNLISITAENQDGVYKTNYRSILKHRCADGNCSGSRGTNQGVPLCQLVANSVVRYNSMAFKTVPELVEFFHHAWNHASPKKMIAVVKKKTFVGLPEALTAEAIRRHFPQCSACVHASLSRKPLPHESTSKYEVGEAWEIDAKGPITDPDGKTAETFSGKTHVITAIDLRTRYIHSFLVKKLSHASKYIQKLINIVKHQKRTIKLIRCDDAFLTNDIKELCQKNQIELQGAVPYEHGQIGHIERLHRTINESIVKALYKKPHLSFKYWGMAWMDSVDKLNMLPNEELDGETPLYLWSGKRVDPNNTPLLPFGTVVQAHIPVKDQHALGGRTLEAFSVGIAAGHKGGILLFNPKTKRYIIRRTFKPMGSVAPVSPLYKIPVEYDTEVLDVEEPSHEVARRTADNADLLGSSQLVDPSGVDTVSPPATPTVPPSMEASHSSAAAPRIKSRSRILTNSKSSLEFSAPKQALAASSGKAHGEQQKSGIPVSWAAAMASPQRDEWLGAAKVETGRWVKMEVYTAVPADQISSIPRDKIVNSTAVLDVKENTISEFLCRKVRVCARGDQYLRNHKIYQALKGDGSPPDFYAGTVKSESVRILLAIAAEKDLELATWDVSTAFLYPALQPGEEIYLRRPKGFTDDQMPALMKLNKCVYGLPQASKYFREHSDRALTNIGFKPTISDPQVYTYREGEQFIYISTHVDDFGVMSNSTALMNAVKAKLDTVYDLKVTDSASYLGLHIERDRANKLIRLSQPKYITDVLSRFKVNTTSSEYPTTPMSNDFNWRPMNKDSPSTTLEQGVLNEAKRKLYMQKIGSLVYLAIMTRPDILFATNILSRFCRAPQQNHMDAVDRVLQYIAGTAHYRYNLHSGEGIVLYATADASYACHTDLKSHTGCTLHIGQSSASVQSISKKQSITADSSTVAEFIAAHTCAKEIMWARNFLEELGFKQLEPTILYQDNQPAISLMTKSGSAFKTKHIALRYHFLREQIKNGVISIRYLPSRQMKADQLTKAFGASEIQLSIAHTLGPFCSADREKNAKN